MSDDMWWPWPPTEYSTQKEEFERDLSDQMRRMIADLDRIFPLLMAPSPLFWLSCTFPLQGSVWVTNSGTHVARSP
jgi:hypothetical protein